MKRIISLVFILSAFIISGCQEENIDISSYEKYNLDQSNSSINDTTYIALKPIWNYQGFNKPQDIMIGRDQLIYVADTENDRIVMLNMDGAVLGTRHVLHPVAIAQDYKLNLIICGKDTVKLADGRIDTLSAVIKLNLVASGHNLETAPLTRLLPRSASDIVNRSREYTGVCVFFDNSFYVSRRGPNNPLIRPDNAILRFLHIKRHDGTETDTLSEPVPLLEPLGAGLLSSNNISSLTSFSKRTTDMIVTLSGDNSFKGQWFQYINAADFSGYQNKLSTSSTDMMRPNRYVRPEDAAIDAYGNIYIVDAAKDSVFKFNSFGDEMESFGGRTVFKNPQGIAHFDKTLYVADTENNRILRFRLSTELK